MVDGEEVLWIEVLEESLTGDMVECLANQEGKTQARVGVKITGKKPLDTCILNQLKKFISVLQLYAYSALFVYCT